MVHCIYMLYSCSTIDKTVEKCNVYIFTTIFYITIDTSKSIASKSLCKWLMGAHVETNINSHYAKFFQLGYTVMWRWWRWVNEWMNEWHGDSSHGFLQVYWNSESNSESFFITLWKDRIFSKVEQWQQSIFFSFPGKIIADNIIVICNEENFN